jgi:predicted NACHT family NTPase
MASIFLSIIIQLFYHLKTIPHSRARLYEEVSRVLLNFYVGSAYHGEINPIIMHDMLADIAFEMQKDHEVLISEDQVKKILAQKLGGDIGKRDQIIAFITNQIFWFTELGPNLYGFMHISFQEYFASVALLHQSHFVQDALDLWQKDGQNWKEVILFAVGSLSQAEQDLVGQLIRALLATHENRSILFAGECLLSTDIQSVKTNLSAEIIDALIRVEGNEGIEPVIRNQANELKQKLDLEGRVPERL